MIGDTELMDVSQKFPATSQSLKEVFESGGGLFGYKIPNYQRAYSWDRSDIKRLLDDCLIRFHRLASDRPDQSFTFLGTIIVVNEQSPESTFTGQSSLIVDGQQRLISLALICCVMAELLLEMRNTVDVAGDVKTWIEKESQDVLNHLFDCTSGSGRSGIEQFHFPRIVRDGDDERAPSRREFLYQSEIAVFLRCFAEFFERRLTGEQAAFDHQLPQNSQLARNYQFLKSQLFAYFGGQDTDLRKYEFEATKVIKQELPHRGFMSLLRLTHSLGGRLKPNTVVSRFINDTRGEALFRTVLFARYLLDRVVITRIVAESEDQAFDIFDALNTTGLPLTAIETLKPMVAEFEKKHDRMIGASCRTRFDSVDVYVTENFRNFAERRTATRDLVTAFALYRDAKQVGHGLSEQRDYLRQGFRSASNSGEAVALDFVCGLADVADFKDVWWEKSGASDSRSLIGEDLDQVELCRLCLMFIKATRTRLSVPILTTFWMRSQEEQDVSFASAAKSIASFIALRRAYTGGTAGIDDSFRQLMKTYSQRTECKDFTNTQLNLSLRQLLNSSPTAIQSKATWLVGAKKTSFRLCGAPITRFMILAAADNAQPDSARPGMMTREILIASQSRRLLSPSVWEGSQYGTVEHIAPRSKPTSGWDDAIYFDPTTCELLGNLILLPHKENASLGFARWPKKKAFYIALAAENENDRQALVGDARGMGVEFSVAARRLIRNQESLQLLSSLSSVNRWTESLIHTRTENVLGMAWDTLAPWLGAFD